MIMHKISKLIQELPYAEPDEESEKPLSPTLLAMIADVNIPQNILEIIEQVPQEMISEIVLSFKNNLDLSAKKQNGQWVIQTDDMIATIPSVFRRFDPSNPVSQILMRCIFSIAARKLADCVDGSATIRYCTICGEIPCNIGPFGWIKVKTQ